ncbi:Holliday junction resolvase RuvX, partial [Candidatus Microgenomates bacterium]|nr:Holliday junction resolvase RuvX [Candidatus Microgenomates bacterium]
MLLGIDYGPKNIGLAISEGEIAEPYSVVHPLSQLEAVVKKLGITKIVVGVSERKSGEEAKSFGVNLQSVLRLPVEFVDETLSSYEAGPKAHAKA